MKLILATVSAIILVSCQNDRNRTNMVFIEGGEFMMGDISGSGTDFEKPVHQVKLSNFYMCKYEVSVEEFSKFINESGYKTDAEKKDSSLTFFKGKWSMQKGVNWRFDAAGRLMDKDDYNHPVVHISWNDANAYCQWLSKKTGHNYRLPTEAEWEFAARNRGSEIQYSWGNAYPSGKNGGNVADESLLKVANDLTVWKNLNDGFCYTSPIGSFNPNKLGLYDMTGNVWEWCNDWFDKDYYKNSPNEDPQGSLNGVVKSFRGGCWFSDENYTRITFHNFGNYPNQSYGDFGFRIAMTPK